MSIEPTTSPFIIGQYSDGKTSRRTEAELYLTDDNRIGLEGIDEEPVSFEAINISARVGNTPRYVELPNGAHFETTDNDGIDRILIQATGKRTHNFVHKLESSKRWVLATLLVMIFFGWGFIQYGIPYFSKEIAFMFNEQQTRLIGRGALDTLDGRLMQPSELSAAHQQELQEEFSTLLNTLNANNIRLVFRNSDIIGANALALPDGTIVFTDDLIKLAADNNEIVSVMLHEIGHLQYRHSLRRIIQTSSLALFIASITGDVSTSSTIITGLPIVLVESGYSRDMEMEADTFALQYMLQHGIDPAHFSTMMQKLQVSRTSSFLSCIKEETDIQKCLQAAISAVKDNSNNKDKEKNISQYFASHPLTEERIKRFRDASKHNSGDQHSH